MRPILSRLRVIFLFVLAFGVSASSADAQITDVTNTTSTPIPAAGHDYIEMLSETVNPSNGSVSVRLGIPTAAGRGLNVPFTFSYDSNGVHFAGNNANSTGSTNGWLGDGDDFLRAGGWAYSVPYVTAANTEIPATAGRTGNCFYIQSYLFNDPTGGRHSLGLAIQDIPSAYACFDLLQVPSAAGDRYQATASSDTNVKVSDADGTVYNFTLPIKNVPLTTLPTALQIEDRNGNQVNIAYVITANNTASFTVTDTAKRPLISTSGFASPTDTVSIYNYPKPFYVTWGSASYNFTPTATGVVSPCGWLGTGARSVPAVTAIELPNGESYQFQYDSTYGVLKQITYPNGGYVAYTWGFNAQSGAAYWDAHKAGNSCSAIYDVPAILTRTVSYDGKTVAAEQVFSYPPTTWTGTRWTKKQTIVTTSDRIRGTSFQTTYNYVPAPAGGDPAQPLEFNVSDNELPVEQSIVYGGTSGAVLETVTKGWFDGYELACELDMLGSGPIKGTFYAYGPGAVVTDKTEFDYNLITSTSACQNGSTSPAGITPTRETITTYQPFVATPIYPSTAILDRPSSVVIKGAGIRVAETDDAYDGSSVQPITAIAHDDTNYGASYNVRGNLTRVTKQCFPSCTNAVSTSTYDQTGQLYSTADPNTNTTSFSFADSYSSGAPPGNTNAYLTKITRPQTNGIAHVSNYSYGYADGQLTVAKDENGQSTSYTYNDNLDRVTSVQYPDAGQTTIAYNDSVPSVSISKLISSGMSVTTDTVMDSMGHTIKSEVTSDPGGTDYTVATYDGTGHPYLTYNPTRCSTPTTNCGESTWGVSTTTYDALGRTTNVVEQDNSTLTSVYSGNTATVTDEAGKSRENITDGLGRLTEVIESPSGLAYQTNYQYDALNDLLSVSQGGSRHRSFAYNSLAQLTSSINPEVNSLTGTSAVSYAYDANGNLATKTDVRPITVHNSYDALNRITGKTYSNGDPSVSYQYDQTGCSGPSPCYNVGRQTVAAQGGSSNSFSYDSMGRMTGQHAQTNSVLETSSYSYNLIGGLSSLTYPSGRTVRYLYNAAARPTAVYDVANGIKYGEEAIYSPSGSLSSLNYQSVFNTTWIYNSRLQPCWVYTNVFPAIRLPVTDACTATATAGSIMDLKYNFNLGSDNGNVVGITNNRDTTRSQAFTYDSVNRVATAQTPVPCGSNCWSDTFAYDQWANLLSVAATGTAPALPTLTFNSNNHISSPASFTYDAIGNETADTTSKYIWYADGSLKTGGGVTYSYDAHGNRVEKSNGKIYWYGPNGGVLDESDLSGNMTDEYVYFGGKRIAHQVVSSNSVTYYVEDMLGTSRALATSAGTLCYDADFYAFGGEHPYTSTCTQNYKFTGKERDSESGNDYFKHRYYSSIMGRWMSADPSLLAHADPRNPQSLNLYTYVGNNPLSRVDLNGLCWKGLQWACDLGQSLDNALHGYGFHTTDTVNRNVLNASENLRARGTGIEGWTRRQILDRVKNPDIPNPYVTAATDIPNPYVTAATDIAGVVAAAGDHTRLGIPIAVISLGNDPSPVNIGLTAAGLVPELSFPLAFIGAEAHLLNFEAQTVGEGMIEAIPAKTMDDGYGHTIPNPGMVDDQDFFK